MDCRSCTKNHGVTAGHITLLTTAVSTGGFLWWAFTSKTWNRFSLRTVNHAKAINYLENEVKVGDIATTISAMRPMGTVLINDKKYEALSQISFIDVGKAVIVIEVLPNKLVVKEA
ncbi:MAG: NfeD family protein [Bacteroidetes bacterium]|nr:NfeD family protein [Bacteroidota bacterium]